MITKLFNAFIFGLIFVLLLDFILFISLKINYFDFYGIDEYFNTIFTDNQSYLLLLVLSVAFGYSMLYFKRRKVFDKIYIVLILIFATSFYQPIAQKIGTLLFTQQNQNMQVLDVNITTDIVYKGRNHIYLKKTNLSRAVKYRYDEVKVLD